MSCGTKLQPRFNSYNERRELSDRLEREGEYRLAHDVRNEECLSDYDLRRARSALERQGLSKYHDFREMPCHCSTDDEEQF